MPQQLSNWLLFNLIWVVTVLLVGGGVYLTLRHIEYGEGSAVVNGFGSFAILLTVGIGFPSLLAFAVFIPILGWVGAHFHMHSGGRSKTKGEAFILLTFASLISGNIEAFLINPLWPRSIKAPAPLWFLDSPYWLSFLVVAPVALVPFLMWAWKNSKLRPGIGRQLKEGEEL